jgi:hypothetical protein
MLEFMQFKNCPKRADIFHPVDSDYLGLNKAAINEYYHYIESDNPRSASWNNFHEDCKLEPIVTAQPHIVVFQITPFVCLWY